MSPAASVGDTPGVDIAGGGEAPPGIVGPTVAERVGGVGSPGAMPAGGCVAEGVIEGPLADGGFSESSPRAITTAPTTTVNATAAMAAAAR
jgi:hypothetical protein